MRRAEFAARYPALAERGLTRREIAAEMGITPVAVARHLYEMFGSTQMPRGEFIQKYLAIVQRCPDMTNREIARQLGFTKAAFDRRLQRARAAGELTLRRIAWGTKPELAPPGMTRGYIPALAPRRRRKKDLGRAA